jgi:hypothetical protein
MDFEAADAHDIFSPLLTEKALSDVPLFGAQKITIKSLVEKTRAGVPTAERLVAQVSGGTRSWPSFDEASSIADKLKALRVASKEGKDEPEEEPFLSQLERHEKLLTETRNMTGLSGKERFAIDHTMLLRALEGYRFDFTKNQHIVADDPWLRDVWLWVTGKA